MKNPYKAKKVIESKPIDMVYEGINKQENALKELRAKRFDQKKKHSSKKGGMYSGRYDE